MIKQLIVDLASNRIELSTGLTLAKVIASKINSKPLSDWLAKEVNGYEIADLLLPDYRKISCSFFLSFHGNAFPNDGILPFPINVSYKELYDITHFHKVIESIKVIESQLQEFNDTHAEIDFEPDRAQLLFQALITIKPEFNKFKSLYKGCFQEVAKAQYQNVLEQTKQRLVDILLELDKEFPNLENDFKMSEKNEEKVSNIITNNIYGNNNPLNIASGQSVVQKDINNTYTGYDYSELNKLGVQKEDIEALKTIVHDSGKDRNSLSQKSMKWFGSVTASVAAKGLAENTPAIKHFIDTLISNI